MFIGALNLMACTGEVSGSFLSQCTDVLRILVISLLPMCKGGTVLNYAMTIAFHPPTPMPLLAMSQLTNSIQWLGESFKSATVNTNVDYPSKEAIILIIIIIIIIIYFFCTSST